MTEVHNAAPPQRDRRREPHLAAAPPDDSTAATVLPSLSEIGTIPPQRRHEPHLDNEHPATPVPAPPRPEPHFDPGHPPDLLALRIRRIPLSAWQKRRLRWFALLIILSLVVNIGLVALIGAGGGRGWGDGEEQPTPISVLYQPPQPNPPSPPPPPPPPPPKAAQQPKSPPPPPPPPPGRLASDEFGDPNATGKAPVPTPGPAAGQVQPKAGEAPPPPADAPATPDPSDIAIPKKVDDPSHSAAPKQDDIPKTREQMAAAGEVAPPPPPKPTPPAETPTAKAVLKPSEFRMPMQPGGARKPTLDPNAENHGEGHKAKYPGPDATRDEYLAYINSQILQHGSAYLSTAITGPRHGAIELDIRVNPSGNIVGVFVARSSGYPDIDKHAVDLVYSVSPLPPVPKYFQGQDVLGLTWNGVFPTPFDLQ